MTIARLDPADTEAMDRWHDLIVAVTRHDVPGLPTPSRTGHRARFAHPWPSSTEEALLAREGGRVIGAASLLLPEAENRSTAVLELIVHPEHRRRGRLLARAVARRRAGRDRRGCRRTCGRSTRRWASGRWTGGRSSRCRSPPPDDYRLAGSRRGQSE